MLLTMMCNATDDLTSHRRSSPCDEYAVTELRKLISLSWKKRHRDGLFFKIQDSLDKLEA
jgi:hypothetical protein